MQTVDRLCGLLEGCDFGSRLIWKERTDSTNLEIRRAAAAGAPHGTVALAEEQSAGRGRRGRSWDSPPGENLYFSLLLYPDFPVEKAPMLTLVMALAVADAIRRQGLAVKIKWPNDLVLAGRKVCGILTEMYWNGEGRYYVVIGVGINVNQGLFAPGLQETATSLFLEKGEKLDRETLLADVLRRFAARYGRFSREGNLESFADEYEKILVNLHERVSVLDPKGSWQGVAEGISGTGELLVRRGDGSLEAVYAGEVSVRGIYGYV